MSVQFPIVPNIPGVPAVLKTIVTIETTVAQVNNLLGAFFGSAPTWELFDDNGDPISDYDTMLDVSPRHSWAVGTYPVEQGAFAQYNKVESPFECRLTLACGGSAQRQAAFLSDIALACASTDLYTLQTPTLTVTNLNLTRYEYDQSGQRGAGMMVVTVDAIEIRDTVITTYNTTAQPDGAAQEDQGTIQADDFGGAHSGTGAEAVIGDDGLEGDVPDGLNEREGSPAAEATDLGQPYSAESIQSENLPAIS